MNYPFRKRPKPEIERFGRADLAELLIGFEDRHAEIFGERLSSSEFYERYSRGEIDSTFATAWGTFYEAFRRMDADEGITAMTAGLSPSLAGA
jgi:hypothetical protein